MVLKKQDHVRPTFDELQSIMLPNCVIIPSEEEFVAV